jgi:protein-disulfide isomerase
VTLVEFADFQCPYCERFVTETQPQINAAYINTDKVRFGYWNFAFLGQESFWAAEASECAADQNAFWEYHDKLFASQSGENQGAFSKDNLKQFAADLNLDTEVFNQCLDSGKYTSLVQQDTQTAQSLGVSSTPTFLLNGQPIVGAQPFTVFQQGIESALTASNPQ